MKKTIAILLAAVLLLSLCGCGNEKQEEPQMAEAPTSVWTVEQTTDEFGDVTAESVSVIAATFNGTFSNTATANSELTVIVNFAKKDSLNHFVAGFDLKEYNNINATYSSSDTITFKTKVGEEVNELDVTGSAPNGSIFVGKEDYTWGGDYLFNALIDGSDVRCIVTIGSSEYSFTLESADLPALCQKQDIGKGANDLTCREVIKILLDDQGRYVPYACTWLKNHYESLELMDDAAIESALNGYFLDIWVSSNYGGKYIYDNNWFPNWVVEYYSFSKGIIQGKCSFNFGTEIEEQKMKSNITQGIFLSAYNNYRLTGGSGKENRLSVKDGIINVTAELNINGEIQTTSIKYQVRKISEDVFLLCLFNDGQGYVPNSIMVRCSGDTKEAMIATASSVDSVFLPKIPE